MQGVGKIRLLDDAAFLVMPSREEAFGLVALEAMAHGKPVIHFGLPELSRIPADCGLTVPPLDVTALKRAVEELSRDPARRARRGRNARAYVEQHDPAATDEAYAVLVGEALATSPPRAEIAGLRLPDRPTLGAAERAHLSGLAVQLKRSHDVLTFLARRYPVFPADLVTPQLRERAAVRALLERYGIADPTAGLDGGSFTDPAAQQQYDRLLRRGSTGCDAAVDIACELLAETVMELDSGLPLHTAPDVRRVHLHLYATTLRQSRLVLSFVHRREAEHSSTMR